MIKSWTALNINELALLDRFGSPCRRLHIHVLLELFTLLSETAIDREREREREKERARDTYRQSKRKID